MIRPTVHFIVEIKSRLELLLLQLIIFVLNWKKRIEARCFFETNTHTVLGCSSAAESSRCSEPVWHHIPMQVRVLKCRNRVNAEHDLSVELSKTEPRIDMLVENFNQTYNSHLDCGLINQFTPV
jgi:hypothetical protein